MSFIRRKEEVPVENKKMFGGAGEAENRKILLGAEEMGGKGRLFNHVVLRPGCGIGPHVHHGDSETYYFLKGRGEYSDNGVVRTVKPGDVTWTPDGSSHGVENKGDTELTFMALIINS